MASRALPDAFTVHISRDDIAGYCIASIDGVDNSHDRDWLESLFIPLMYTLDAERIWTDETEVN